LISLLDIENAEPGKWKGEAKEGKMSVKTVKDVS